VVGNGQQPADNQQPAADQVAEEADDPMVTNNPFFVSTQVRSVAKYSDIAPPVASAAVGPRDRFDPSMKRPHSAGTIPQNQQAGRRLIRGNISFPSATVTTAGATNATGARIVAPTIAP
jgi:hypothetical protein